MAELQLQLDGTLNLILIAIELLFFIGFLVIYARRKNSVLKPLIWSLAFFLLSNIFSLIFILTYDGSFNWNLINIILAHFFVGGGLLLLIYYLEMFESDEPFTKRSTIGTILIMLTGSLQLISNFVQPIVGLLVPIPYMITGIMYLKYIRSIKSRATIRSQTKKIRRVSSGIFMIFIAPLVIYIAIGMIVVFLVLLSGAEQIDTYTGLEPETFNIGSLDPIVMLSQLVGIVLISMPVLISQSPYFMQSRKISRLTIINNTGLPVYDFNFEPHNEGNELLLSGALTAIKTVMSEATGSSSELKSIIFGDLNIITEVRDEFAANLIVERSSAYLKESLRLFTDEFQALHKLKANDSVLIEPKLQKEADKLLQKIFGIGEEEMEEILTIHNSLAEKPSAT